MKRDKLLFAILMALLFTLFVWSVKRAIPSLQAQFVEWAAAKASEALNTGVHIEAIRLTRFAGIEVEGLTIMDPLNEGEKFFFSPRIELKLKPLRMIEGHIEFRMIAVYDPEIRIAKESGKWNVKSFGKRRTERQLKKKRSPFRMKINRLILRNSRTQVSGLTGEPFETQMDFNGSLEIGGGKVLIGMEESSLNTSFVSFGAFLFEGNLTIEGKRLTIDDFKLVKEDTRVEGSGYMEFHRPPTCHFDIRSENFDFAHIPPGVGTRKYLQGSTQLEAILDGRLLNPDVVGNVSNCQGNLLGYEFESLSGVVGYSEGRVEVKGLESRICGGKLSGDFNFDFTESPASYFALANIDSFNLVKLPYEIPPQLSSLISGDLAFEGEGFDKKQFKAGSKVSLARSKVGEIEFNSLDAVCTLTGEGLEIEDGSVSFDDGYAEYRGNFNTEGYTLSVDASEMDIGQLPDLLDIPDLAGTLSFDGQVKGAYGEVDLDGLFQLATLSLGEELAIRRIQGSCRIDDLPYAPKGNMEIRADTVSVSGVRLESIETGVLLDEGHLDMKNVFVRIDSTEFVEFSLGVAAGERGYTLSFSDLTIFHGSIASSTPGTLVINKEPGKWVFERSTVSFAGGKVTLRGQLASEGSFSLEARADSVDIYQASQFIKIKKRMEGRLEAEILASGTLDLPRLSVSMKARDVFLEDAQMDSMVLGASYASQILFIDDFSLWKGDFQARGTMNIPLDLAMTERDRRLNPEGNLYGEVLINVPLNYVNLLSSDFRASGGIFTANFSISGTAGDPEWSGLGRISGGSGLYIPTNSYLENINASFRMEENSLFIDSLKAGSLGGEVLASGRFDCEGFVPRNLQIAIHLKDFGVHQIKHVSELIIDGDLVLEGSIYEPLLRGNLLLAEGELSVPFGRGRENETRRDVITFPINLDVVAVGRDNVWFRNKQANIEMEIDLTVRGGPDGVMVSGEMRPQRGFYTFYGRKFQIEEGSVRFVGSKRINPILDVSASRVIRGRVGTGADAEMTENTLNLHVGGFYDEVEFDVEVFDETGTRLPVPREEAFTLLILDMTKQEYDAKVGAYRERVGNQVASMMTQQAASLIQDASPLDVITFDAQLFTTGGTESAQFSVGKYLARKFFVSYSQDIMDPNVNNFSVEYGLRRRMFIVGQTNSAGSQFSIDFKYRFRY